MTRGTPSEESLIAGLRAGGREAFRELFDRHKDPMLRLANRILGHREDAEDAVQDAFVAVHARIGSFRGESAFSTWLYRITVNACLQARRRRGSKDERALSDAATAELTSRARAGGDDEARALLEREIDALPPRQRMVFTLAAIEELPQVEVAAILDLSPGTVRYHLHEARRRLESQLRQVLDVEAVITGARSER
jgi:RNA polymerase sigma-70 factor (ECF subfamily)